MTIARKGFSGTAVPSSLNGAIAAGATTIVINATTGWPDGTNGKSPAKIDPGLPTEEDILFTARSGNNLTTVSRAQNGTVAASHANGAVIIHGWSAGEADELYQHVSDVEATPHSTKLLSPTTHAATLHTVGTTLPALGSAQNLGDTADGSGATLAGGNHAHGFPPVTAYTPTWRSNSGGGTQPVLGGGTLAGNFVKVGKMGWFSIILSCGPGTTFGNSFWEFSLPAGWTAALTHRIPCDVRPGQAGIDPTYLGMAFFSVGYVQPASASAASAAIQQVTPTYPYAWTTSGFLFCSGWVPLT